MRHRQGSCWTALPRHFAPAAWRRWPSSGSRSSGRSSTDIPATTATPWSPRAATAPRRAGARDCRARHGPRDPPRHHPRADRRRARPRPPTPPHLGCRRGRALRAVGGAQGRGPLPRAALRAGRTRRPRRRQRHRRSRTLHRPGDRPRQDHRGRPRDPPRRTRTIPPRTLRPPLPRRRVRLPPHHRPRHRRRRRLDRRHGRPRRRHPRRDHGHDHNHDELRSLAIGWLARPVDLLKLLLEHTEPSTTPAPTTRHGEPADSPAPAWAPDHMADTIERLCCLPARTARRAPRPRHASSSTSPTQPCAPGTASPASRASARSTYDQLAEVLGHADVTVTPVLDLPMRRRADAYEHPETIKDHVWVQTGGDVLPLHPSHRHPRQRRLRPRHPLRRHRPTRPDRPPQLRAPTPPPPPRQDPRRLPPPAVVGPGRHLWRTPHGQAFLVDHTGTTKLTDQQGASMAEAIEDGVELYFT